MFDNAFLANLFPAIIVTICIYISMRFIDLADMTCDGSFALGACVFIVNTLSGNDFWISLLLSCIAGGVAGYITSCLINKLNINGLLASIINMTGIGSINFLILGAYKVDFSNTGMLCGKIEMLAILSSVFYIILLLILMSKCGIILKSFALNKNIIKRFNIKEASLTRNVIVMNNAFTAIAGALFVQMQSSVTCTVGAGTVINSIIAFIIGENFIKCKSGLRIILACILGTLIHQSIVQYVTHEQGFGISRDLYNLVISILIISVFVIVKIRDSKLLDKDLGMR